MITTFMPSVLFLLNGKRLNSEDTGSLIGASTIPLSIVKRVEFVRGPGSALYGSNALTGVVNIITDDTNSRIQLKTGSHNNQQLTTQYSSNYNNWQYSINAKFEKDDGELFENVYDGLLAKDLGKVTTTDIKDQFKEKSFFVKVDNDHFSFQTFYKKSNAEGWFISRRVSEDNQMNRETFFVDGDYHFNIGKYKNRVGLGYTYTYLKYILPIVSEELIDYVYSGINATYGTSFDAPNDVLYQADLKTQELKADWEISVDNFIFGLEARRYSTVKADESTNYDYAQLQVKDFPLTYYNGDFGYVVADADLLNATRDIFGIYGQYSYQLFENTNLIAGIRYDKYSDFGSSLNPRVAIVQSIAKNHSLKLSYAEAFRAPTIIEMRSGVYHGVDGNINLDAEKAKTTELIYTYKNNSGFYASTSLFHNEIDNNIVETVILTDTTNRTFVNSGMDIYEGIEFEAFLPLAKNTSFRLNGTKFFTLPQNSIGSTDLLFGAILNHNITPKWNTSISANYSGKRDYYNPDEEPKQIEDYIVGNFYTSYKFDDVKVFGQIKNIADTYYESPSIDTMLDAGIPRRGRTFYVGLEYNF
jgi:outer membrane receptor protein involved in Fe transport